MNTYLRKGLCSLGVYILLLCSQACADSADLNVLKQDIVVNYTSLAHAIYEDALHSARALKISLASLVEGPTEQNLDKAKIAWKAANPDLSSLFT